MGRSGPVDRAGVGADEEPQAGTSDNPRTATRLDAAATQDEATFMRMGAP